MQQQLALVALGSGGLTGKGAGNVPIGRRVPEGHNDMIFALIGEQFGFFGSAVVLIAYVVLFIAGIEIASGTREPFGRLVAIAVSVALVVAGATWLLAPPPPPVEASLPFTPGATTSIAGAAGGVGGEPPPSAAVVVATPMVTAGAQGAAVVVPVDIVVHVAGAVVAPGIHRLPATARVADAVAAAGGPTADAHTDAINLAAVVHDGDRVHVPRISEGLTVPAGVTAGSTAIAVPGNDASAPVAINIATTEQLDTLPGVGPATAAAIVAHREANGPFASIDALADVRGIGPAKLETLRSFVTL